jgi:hypothetical protein
MYVIFVTQRDGYYEKIIFQLWRGWDFSLGHQVQASSGEFKRIQASSGQAFHPTGSLPGVKCEADQLRMVRGLRMSGGLPQFPCIRLYEVVLKLNILLLTFIYTALSIQCLQLAIGLDCTD